MLLALGGRLHGMGLAIVIAKVIQVCDKFIGKSGGGAVGGRSRSDCGSHLEWNEEKLQKVEVHYR